MVWYSNLQRAITQTSEAGCRSLDTLAASKTRTNTAKGGYETGITITNYLGFFGSTEYSAVATEGDGSDLQQFGHTLMT